MNEIFEDIRWLQRFDNFKKALSQLTAAMQQKEYNNLEKQGVIQSFEQMFAAISLLQGRVKANR